MTNSLFLASFAFADIHGHGSIFEGATNDRNDRDLDLMETHFQCE